MTILEQATRVINAVAVLKTGCVFTDRKPAKRPASIHMARSTDCRRPANLVDDFIRESLTLGLDREDIIIRRRIRQKLDFITEGIAGLFESWHCNLVVVSPLFL